MFYMFLADGFEETEALVTLDMMRRAEIQVNTVGINSEKIVGSHGITVISDIRESDVVLSLCDGIVLPGGMPGTENLYASSCVKDIIKYCMDNNKLIAAICAAPIILGRNKMLINKNAVCFPGFENELIGAKINNSLCIADGNIITAKGAGAVFEFSDKIIKYICGEEKANSVIKIIQHKGLE